MMRTLSVAAVGLTAVGMTLGSLPAAQAAPLPAMNAMQVGGPVAGAEKIGWRRGYYGGYGYRRRGIGAGGALAAGAALGLIGGAIAASAAPRYGYYGRPAYGYGGYGGYGYGYRPVYGGYGGYGYGYGGPAYGGYYGY